MESTLSLVAPLTRHGTKAQKERHSPGLTPGPVLLARVVDSLVLWEFWDKSLQHGMGCCPSGWERVLITVWVPYRPGTCE